MTNNDILIRLRYALDIKDKDMVEIFQLGDVDVTQEEVEKILTKPVDSYDFDSEEEYEQALEEEDILPINNNKLEAFLNGFIIFKRGRQEPKPGQPEKPPFSNEPANNILLKKLKIALSLTTDDIIDTLAEAGVSISKSELGAFLRKKGHKNYKVCMDKYARNFLKGLALRYR
ncbi:uncharacterized protein YehS (DUF1456 family) [Bacillus tianshenii]|uniref:Uncharacterized protein YehS (DUF1456 family) n=1 Tax=Sutcliffiella tianshenii TaxID=1463404 RepID=A0ABS2NZ62_9BACI|nr:DUF1456 family protein [Bacillus tianshenii]MBM7619950.1 uncharacterized protein YehS (DUF1456 family) [Bacillus tianshenii]